MAYDSTSAVPRSDGERSVFKQVDLSNSDTYPVTVWAPPQGKRVVIDDILFTVREASGNRCILNLDIRKDAQWDAVVQMTQVGNGSNTFGHSFIGKLSTEKGNGSATKIRVTKPGPNNSTNFVCKLLIVGRLV